MRPHRLLGIGNPLMDVIANVDIPFLARFGLETNRAILAQLEHQKLFAELKTTFKPTYLPGGAAQNTVRAAQWLLQEKFSAGIIGSVGNDWYAEEMTRILQGEGVVPYYHKISEKETGLCAVLVNSKERALVYNLSASLLYPVSHLKSIWQTVQTAEMYYFTTFFFRSSMESIWEIVNHATLARKPIALNLASTSLIEVFTDSITSLLPNLDYVFCDESEAIRFAELTGNRSFDLKEIALQMANYEKLTSRPRTVVITRRAKNTVIAYNGTADFYPVGKIDSSEIVDASGAGDVFAGAFLAAQLMEKDLQTSVDAANYVAVESLKRVGCALPKEAPSFIL